MHPNLISKAEKYNVWDKKYLGGINSRLDTAEQNITEFKNKTLVVVI